VVYGLWFIVHYVENCHTALTIQDTKMKLQKLNQKSLLQETFISEQHCASTFFGGNREPIPGCFNPFAIGNLQF
jgi:hypothetical protein